MTIEPSLKINNKVGIPPEEYRMCYRVIDRSPSGDLLNGRW
jgi:hypothetical protein